jgi:TRAP-type C4-dicarboxylate transport system substrate-binding protein
MEAYMNKRRGLIVGVALILMISTMLAGCGSGTGSSGSTGNAGGGAASTETPAGDPIVIKVNNFMPEGQPPSLGTAAACAKLEELSGGTIKTEQYYNGTLLGFNDSWQGTGSGAVDVAIFAIATIDSNTILNNVFSIPLPNLNVDQVKTTAMFNELIDLEPSLNEELVASNLRWLSLQSMPNLNLHLQKKEVRTIADVKGIKIEGLGAVNSKYWEKLGATTVSLDPGDYYLSCERGVVDGMFTHWSCIEGYKLNDVLHSHTTFGDFTPEYPAGNGISTGCMAYGVNLDTWNSLTEEQQGWLQEAFRYGAAYSAELDTGTSRTGYNLAIESGDVIINITGDDLKPWHDAMQAVVDEWITASEAAGQTTAPQVRATLLKLVDEYKTK